MRHTLTDIRYHRDEGLGVDALQVFPAPGRVLRRAADSEREQAGLDDVDDDAVSAIDGGESAGRQWKQEEASQVVAVVRRAIFQPLPLKAATNNRFMDANFSCCLPRCRTQYGIRVALCIQFGTRLEVQIDASRRTFVFENSIDSDAVRCQSFTLPRPLLNPASLPDENVREY